MNKKAKEKVISLFDTYRTCKYLISVQTNEEHGDITGANYFCKDVELLVDTLPDTEAELIRVRYLQSDSDYITDQEVYSERMNPPISAVKYTKIRNGAFKKIYPALNVGEITIKTPYVSDPIFRFQRTGHSKIQEKKKALYS